jgi:hypothetical protein
VARASSAVRRGSHAAIRRQTSAALKGLHKGSCDKTQQNAILTGKTLSLLLRARLKCPSFSSGFGSSCLSNFLKWAEPEVFGLQSVEESGWAVNFIRKLPRPILKTKIVRQKVADGVGLLGPIAACLL